MFERGLGATVKSKVADTRAICRTLADADDLYKEKESWPSLIH